MSSRIRKVELYDADRPGWLASDHIALLPGGVTIDAQSVSAGPDGKKILKSGTPVGRLTNGLYGPANGTTVTAAGLAAGDCDVTNGNAEVSVLIHGVVMARALPVTITPTLASQMPLIKFLGMSS